MFILTQVQPTITISSQNAQLIYLVCLHNFVLIICNNLLKIYILIAGIETSTITLGFAVRYMAGLPDIQSKVQEEIDRVVGEYF